MTQPIRWGILGTGQIARSFAAALRTLRGASLVAVASRNPATAQSFADEFGADRHYADYQLLADDPQVDVAYIATPHSLHAANAMQCLRAGKAVLCEKPFAINAREAREVIELAGAKKLFLMEAMWTRFLPAVQEVRRLLETDAIGTPRLLQADFGFAAEAPPAHRLRNKELGGGALLDIGIYPLSIAAYLLGEIESAQAMAALGDTGVDEQTAFILTHRGGALSSGLCSTQARTPVELTVSGSLGHLRLHAPFFKAPALTISAVNREARTLHLPYLDNGYTHEAIEVMRCLHEGLLQSPVMPPAETLALMQCMDTMREQIGVKYPADSY